MRTALTCAALLGLTACTTVPSPRALTTREVLADALIDIIPPRVMFAELAEPYAASYGTAQRRDKAHASFMSHLDDEAVEAILRQALVRRFTEEELRALLAFCSTPEGRACLAKVAPFAAEVLPACLHEATRAYRDTALDAARGRLLP